jgi:hypothetical protein
VKDDRRELSQAEAIAVAERFLEDHGYTRATEIVDGLSSVQYERRAWGIRRIAGIWQVLFLRVGPDPFKIYHLGPDGGSELDLAYMNTPRGAVIVVMPDGSKVYKHHLDGLLSGFTPLRPDAGP